MKGIVYRAVRQMRRVAATQGPPAFLLASMVLMSAAVSQPARAATLNAQGKVIWNQLYNSGMIQALTWKVTQTRGRPALKHAGKLSPYRGVKPPKAMALCVHWSKATATHVPVVGFYYWYASPAAATRSLANCRRVHEPKGCRCALFDRNDRNVLAVPEAVMRRLGGLQ